MPWEQRLMLLQLLRFYSQANTRAEAAPMNPKKGAVSWLDIFEVAR